MVPKKTFFLLFFLAFAQLCQAQNAKKDTLIIAEVEYIHQFGNQSNTSIQSFFKDNALRDSILSVVDKYIDLYWAKFFIDDSEASIKTKPRNVSGSLLAALPKFKPTLPANANAAKAYLFLQIYGKDEGGTTWTFRYQLLQGDKFVAENKKEIKLQHSLGSYTKWIDKDGCIRLLDAGFNSLFKDHDEAAVVYVNPFNEMEAYSKTLSTIQQQKIAALYPSFRTKKLQPYTHTYTIFDSTRIAWTYGDIDRSDHYTKKNVGGDVASSVFTALTGWGTATEREMVYDNKVSINNSATHDTMECTIYISGTRVKEKRRVKNNDGSFSTASNFLFSRNPSQTAGDIIMQGKMVVNYKAVTKDDARKYYQNDELNEVLGMDTDEGFSAKDGSFMYSLPGVSGTWDSTPFSIVYRLNGSLTEYRWNNELVAFSVQKASEPTLYVLKESRSPLDKLAVLQHIIYQVAIDGE